MDASKIQVRTIVPKGIARLAWQQIAMKLIRNAVPHTIDGTRNADINICFNQNLPLILDQRNFKYSKLREFQSTNLLHLSIIQMSLHRYSLSHYKISIRLKLICFLSHELSKVGQPVYHKYNYLNLYLIFYNIQCIQLSYFC